LSRVEVSVKPSLPDPRGESLKADIRDLGIATVQQARVSDVYLLEGDLSQKELEKVCRELLADPVVEEYSIGELPPSQDAHAVEVAYNPGVMDPVEESVSKGIGDLGITTVTSVKTAKRYYLSGNLSANDIEFISSKLLVNSVIQHVVTGGERVLPPASYDFSRVEVELLTLNDEGLTRLGREKLELNLEEMKQVQGYFAGAGRNPTDVELETLAQTWSEHCKHKTFNSRIRFNDEVIDNLLKSTVMRVTEKLAKPWCLSTFRDNSGVIDFDGRYALCFKVETHNHPSAIEPYGGASTGLGGVIRDPLGTGLGAKPIANTDVFCFAPPDFPHDKLPAGILHPRRILKGVRAGVADYGNRMGIPTVNGAILFDDRYRATRW
jgi:phosphoribosylformylglycinamidine (FGAM) synthase PurS component